MDDSVVERYMSLFRGLPDAHGTGAGRWVKSPPRHAHYRQHLLGLGPGLGIAPLMRDGMVWFGAIDLDEPDFDTAFAMASVLPGPAFVEKSRSGNAHVLVFFESPVEAWVVRGILRYAIATADRKFVEIFPKQDRLDEGMLGNYLNLCYHGDARPVLGDNRDPLSVEEFLNAAEKEKNDPQKWRSRAGFLQINPPAASTSKSEFGSGVLHECAMHIVENCETNPIADGHRAAVYFALSKQFLHAGWSTDETLGFLREVNDASTADPKTPESELRRIMNNALRGQFTSTGCDDPLVQPYCSPDCTIANR